MTVRGLDRVAVFAVVAALAWSARPAPETDAQRVDRITAELRCVVCQGLSVKDSPAESARQMYAIVQRRVAEGRSDDEIRDEFRASYGDWVVLSPPVASWSGLMWLAPFVAVAVGLSLAWAWMRSRAARCRGAAGRGREAPLSRRARRGARPHCGRDVSYFLH